MRIVYLNPVGALGGGERSLLDLIASLRSIEPSIEMHLIACTQGPLISAARELGAEVRLIPMPPILANTGDSRLRNAPWRRQLDAIAGFFGAGLAARRYARQLRDVILEIRPDLVHSNGLKCHLLTSLARPANVPVVWHVRDFLGSRPLVGRLLRYAASRGTTAIANSQAVADDLRATLGRRADRVSIEVVYNGIDTDAFAPAVVDGAELDEAANLPAPPAGTVRAGLIATYARWKGQDLFLNAARRVLERRLACPIRFYIVGGPIYHTSGSQFTPGELHELAVRLGIADHVGFVPLQDRPADAYRSLDVVVHASTQPEPFGRTIVEAMSCGRAVIISAEGGAPELFTDGRDAIGVPPRDADALASAIARLAADPPLRARLGAAARETAVRRFSRNRLGPEVLRIYYRLLTTPAR